MSKTLRTAVMAALLLAAGNAWALGLGQIQVKSKRNQPLLAEIPIVSTTPGELAALQARLASPETFRRIGLAPPSGVAADLQFSLGSDAKGRPVIRVTTLRPVEQAVLNFLIEVDWGAGRLVREYSVLVDAPNTAGAALPPSVQMPQAPVPNLVQRPIPAATTKAAEAEPIAPAPQPVAPAPIPAPAEPPAPVADIAPQSSLPSLPPMPSSFEPAPPVVASTPTQYGPVKRGESLSKIASGLDLRSAFSLDQTMLALLQANPDAFLGDDVNRLRSGAVLRVPSQDEVAKIDAAEASQVVRQQMREWRQSRRAVRQPDSVATAPSAATPAVKADAPPAVAAEAKPKPANPPAPKPVAAPAAETGSTSARRQEARLQIVPPAAPGKATGNKSGTNAGGEGSMLQQEVRQRDEDIAAKAAEIGELKERLAALEKLKAEQQKLISLKDSELAAVQARLAEANKAAQQAPTTTPAAKAATQQPAPAAETAASSNMPWLWGGLGVVALALLAWLLAGRRKPAAPVRRSSVFDSEVLATSMEPPAASEHAVVQGDDQVADADADVVEEVEAEAESEAESSDGDAPEARIAKALADAPAWHSHWVKGQPAAPVMEPAVAEPPVAEPQAPAIADIELPDPAEIPAQATAEQRFKLARAFLDAGDEFSAQQLLLELLDDEDPAMSDEAARMLSKLVG